MEFTIRKAEKTDAASLLGLIRELAIFEREPEAVVVTEKDIQIHGFGPTPLFHCIVAEKDHTVVGMALFYPRYSTWKGPTFHLEDLIVTEVHKGKGVGTALYQAFIAEAYEAGVNRIEWVVLDWNTPAVQFYKNSGAKVLEEWNTVQMDRDAMDAYLKKRNESI
ncbi:MAG: GNAT family N-acetyltransferase [Flavobacteriaceae bacterium]